MSIRIRHLRLVGQSRSYDVSFTRDGSVRSLSTVAGEIATGKTSVLRFIDFCLGAATHPQHPEILRKVDEALLEVELSGEVHVIQRRVFAEDQYAIVHDCVIDELGKPHARARRGLEAGLSTSLPALLLSHCGLSGISLKEAPTQPASKTSGAELPRRHVACVHAERAT